MVELAAGATSVFRPIVQFAPPDIARRHGVTWNGLEIDAVQVVRHQPFEYGFRGSCHLLIMAELAERDDGETFVEGLPKSTLREFSGRLSLVPSGHRFFGWQRPRVLTRVTYFYIDPRGPLLDPELRFAEADLRPRLFFLDKDLWATAAKLKAQSNHSDVGSRQYVESLITVLAHELLRLNNGTVDATGYIRGGLAGWQRKRVAEYIEDHLSEYIPLSTLAEGAKLSPFHFSRAFKQSFGVPPHRYLAGRRIERAKNLLADLGASVTQIEIAMGFSDISSFTTAFRKHTGLTPTAYRRGLD